MRKVHFLSLVASLYLSTASCTFATNEDLFPPMSSQSAPTTVGAPSLGQTEETPVPSNEEACDYGTRFCIVSEHGRFRNALRYPVEPMPRVADLLIDPALARERVSTFKASLQNEEATEASDHARDLEIFQAFYSLPNGEKTCERDHYTRLIRRLVEQDQTNDAMSLSHQKALLCDVYHMGMVDVYETAANRYIAHPDFRASQGTDPLAGARAYGFLNDYTKSFILYQLAWRSQKTQFSLKDLCFFVEAIYRSGITIKGGSFKESAADVCLEALRTSEPYEEDFFDCLAGGTLLSCVDILSYLNKLDEARAALKRYFMRKNELLQNAHLVAANFYLKANEPDMAAYYWRNALNQGYRLNSTDVAGALESFLKNKDTRKALKLWEVYKASDAPKTQQSYIVAAYHFKVALMHEKALECIEEAFALPHDQGLTHHDIYTAAMIYSDAHLHHKAVEFWRTWRKTHVPLERRLYAIKPMVFTFAGAGDYKEASACIYELTQEALTNPLAKTLIQNMPIAEWAMHHLRAGEFERAVDFMKVYGKFLEKKPIKSARGSRVTKKTREATMADMMATLRTTLAQETHEEMRASLKEILNGERHVSQEMRAKVKEISQRADKLAELVKHSSGPSYSVTGQSGVTLSSSSSSSYTTEPDGKQDPLFQLQRLRGELTSLRTHIEREWEATQLALRKNKMRESLQVALDQTAVVFEGFSSPSLQKTVRQNARRVLDAHKAKEEKRAARSASSSSSSTAASSSRLSSVAPVDISPPRADLMKGIHDVTFFITPLAKKHLAQLKRMPGYEAKFDAFMGEVERNPWARRGHGEFFVGAHTKLLKGYDNVFSKRFASKERFLYRVEKGPDGKVYVTILSLLEHDL